MIPITSISEKDRARIVKILLKVKLQGMATQLASLQERNFALFLGDFSSNCSSEFLLLADSEELDSKSSL